MKNKMIKRALAFVMAGALVLSGISVVPPVETQAAEAWTWNPNVSQSGYRKIFNLTADAESVNQSTPASNVVDRKRDTRWHSDYSNNSNAFDSGKTSITITLPQNQSVKGLTYLPTDQPETGNNGTITSCTVAVSSDGTTFTPVDIGDTGSWTVDRTAPNWQDVEREILFTETQTNVKAVKLTAVSTSGTSGNVNKHISAGEIALLAPAEIPQLSVGRPQLGGAPSEVSVEGYSNEDGIKFTGQNEITAETATPEAGRGLTLSQEDGRLGFNGFFTFQNDKNKSLNMTDYTPFLITFDIKIPENYTADENSTKTILGKTDNQYGVNLKGKKIQFYAYSSLAWRSTLDATEDLPENEWKTVSALYDGKKFWLFIDGEKACEPTDELRLVENNSNAFSIGYNFTQSGRLLPEGVYLSNIAIYRMNTNTDAGTYTARTDEDVATFIEKMKTDGACALKMENSRTPYTVSQEWTYTDGSEREPGSAPAIFEEGKIYTVTTTLTARDGFHFQECNKPSSILVDGDPVALAAEDVSIDEGGNTMTISYTFPVVVDLSNGLIGHYTFEEEVDGAFPNIVPQEAPKRLGNAVKQETTVTQSEEGVEGKSVSFSNGINTRNGYLTVENAFSSKNSMTLSFWMKAGDYYKTNSNQSPSIFHQGNDGRAILYYRNEVKAVGSYLPRSNHIYSDERNLGESFNNAVHGEMDTEEWHHVVLTNAVDSESGAAHVSFYVDGVEGKGFDVANINDSYHGVADRFDQLIIGAHKNANSAAHYNGLLDNVRIYNKALNSVEIEEIYEEERPVWTVAVQTVPGTPEDVVPSVSKSEVEHMGEVTFTAPQKAGYNFAGWFTDPAAADTSKVSEAAEYTTKIYKNLTLYAKYELLPGISVTGDVEENQLDNPGSVTFTVNGGDSHNAGETVSDVRAELDSLVFTAQVNDGYYFVEWVDEDGQLLSRDNPYSVTAGRNDLNCYARFKKAAESPVNVARGKTVTTPEGKATDSTSPSNLVDGNDGNFFGFAKNTATNLYTDTAHVCLDLGKEYENIDHLRMKCLSGRTYYGIVIVISDDPDFSADDTVVYNSDRTYPNANNAASSLENVHGFGAGTETPYAENGGFHTFAIPEGISGRYIGIYMRGNSENVGNHICEFEVYVQPADPTRLEAKVTEAEQKLEEIEAGDITYSVASVKALSDAKDAANAAVESIDENGESGSIVVLTESEIDAYIQNIENAIKNLTEYDPNVQAQYWDEEKEKETLATQDDNDIWQYQIKESGAWTTLSDGVFHPDAADGEGIWMSDGSSTRDGYYYAAIGRTKLTPCFEEEAHQAVAYAWNAASADVADAKYVKLVLKKNVHTAEATDKQAVVMQVIAETQDGTETVLNQQTLPIGGSEVEKDLFTSVAKKAGLKYLRLAALKANNDVFDVEAAVETATAKEYAEQYVLKMQAKQQTWAEEHLYTDQSTEAFDEALNALQTALAQPETPDNTIDSLITAMEKADAGLKNYVQATTLTLTADRETTLTAIDGSVIMKAKITAPQDATPAKSYAWTLEGNAEMVSKEETEAGDADDAIVLKATAKGSGTVTVKVTATLEDGTNLESTPVEVKVQVPYTVTAGYVTGSEEKGTVQVSATQDAQDAGTMADVEANGTAYFKAVPGDGYQFAGWFASKDGNDEAVDANASYEKTPVTEDFSLYAKFVVDKTELDALLTSCNELNAADYTKASWDAYTAVRNKAEAINEKLEATVDEIAGAVRDLTAASTVGTSESGLRRYQPLAENDAKIMSVDTPLEKITSREAGLIYPGGENEEDIVAYSLQVKLGKDYYKDDLKIDWNPGDDKIRVQAIKDYPSRATLNVEAGAIGEISVTVTTTNGAGESTQTTAVCQVEVGYKIETGYVEGSEGRGSVKVELKKSDGNALNADSLLLASEADQAILTPEAAEGYILVGLYKDSKGEEAWHESLDASYTYTGSGNSATDADKDGVITFYAKFAADKSELAKQIEEAKARMAEQDYETKYTQESRDTLDTAYKAAQSVDGDPDPTKENVQQAAQKLKEAIEGLTEETPKETLTLKLEVSKTEGDDAQPMGRIWCDSEEWTDGQTKEDFDVDQEVTVKAEANEGYEFQYWEDLNGNKVVSEIAEYTFNIFSHMKLKAVFKETAKVTYTVEFKTSDKFANQVADRQVLSVDREGESINVTVPQPLSYFDYEFKGWALEGQDNISIEPDKAGQQISVTGDTTYIAVYEPKDDEKLSVTIKGNTGSITSGNKAEDDKYVLNTLLTVTAGDAPEGKPNFDGWYLIDEGKSEGIKVSSTTVYKFYVKKDMVLEARFSETEVAHDEPVATFTTSRTVKEGAPTKDACKLQLTWDAPEGCKIVTQGVMRMYGTGATKTEEELAAAGKAMVYGTSNKNVTTNNYGSTKWSGVYTYNLTIGSAEKVGLTLYARGYVVYKDKNGEQKVLYTDVYALEKITRE